MTYQTRRNFVIKKRHTELQIAYALKQAETGTPTKEIIRHMGISEATFYNWKQRFSGLTGMKLSKLR